MAPDDATVAASGNDAFPCPAKSTLRHSGPYKPDEVSRRSVNQPTIRLAPLSLLALW